MAHSDTFFSDLLRARTDYRSLTDLEKDMGIPLRQRLRNARKAQRMPGRSTINAIIEALPQIHASEIQMALLQDASPATVDYNDGSDRRARNHVTQVLDAMPKDKRDVLIRIIDDIAEISR